jgi:glyoxylase-like metal-dependent hydrolase (beta-lactamase superfamily II)
MSVPVHPVFSPWGRFGLYSFLIDAPELAVVDTGITTSPAAMTDELTRLGRRIEDVKWILLTHGHIDHVGGAHALWELTGRRAQVVIHEADAPMLRSRRAHVEEYLAGRGRYIGDSEGEAKVTAATESVISGEMEPTMLLEGGETLSLGGDVTVSVHSVPGHTPGSVAYVVDGQNDVFVGDAVQIHGAANGFPGYADPAAYRASIEYLRDRVRPERLFLGHPYRLRGQEPLGVQLDRDQAQSVLAASLDIESDVRAAACGCLESGLTATDSPYSPFAPAAEKLGYDGDPTLEPSPFFTTMHGYRPKPSGATQENTL